MNIDKEHFDAWMERILEKMEAMERKFGEQQNEVNKFDGERLYDNQDLCLLLNISKRTLQRYRSSGRLKYHYINQKIFYRESEVHRFLRGELGQDNQSLK